MKDKVRRAGHGKAAENLRRREERLGAILESTRDIIYSATDEGKITYISPQVSSLGFSPEEIVGTNLLEHIHPDDTEQVLANFRKVLTTGLGVPMYFRLVAKDGSAHHFEEFGKATRINGKVVQITGVLRDVSERKRAEERLRESGAQYRTLFETSRDAIMMLDRTGFFDCNKATLDLFGCATMDQFVSKHPSELSPALQPDGRDSLAAAQERIEAAFREGGQFFEWLHKRLDGTVFPAEVLLSRLELRGRTVLQAVVRDVAERKRGEQALRAAHEELEQRVRERTEELVRANEVLQAEMAERKRAQEVILRQAREILELGTPVVEVWEGLVLAPLIGTLDSQRAEQFMDRLLTCVEQSRAEVAVVDITGVPAIDTQTARYLIETFNAVRLLGSQVIMTGVRPAIAQTLVHLGIDLSNVITRASLAAGLRVALDTLSLEVVRRDEAGGSG